MIVYKDFISGDELFSDSYPLKLVDELYYEVEGKVISESYDIDERLIGGNKATEAAEDGEDEGVDSTAVTGINIVLAHKLAETGFTKDSFKLWLKGYMKTLKEKVQKSDPSRVEKFQKAMAAFCTNTILKNFDNWRFYTGEKMHEDGMIVIQGYREDQVTPYFIFFADGIEIEKF